ncbi:MAG: hypothetical protein ABSA30_00080 [Candidatus Aminicenantales bacterium]|jgi:hypothetical protein
MRDFLVYVSADSGRYLGEFLGEDRLFDLAVNNFRGEPFDAGQAEYSFATAGHKWRNIARDLPAIARRYRACAFLDDDLAISTATINRAFQVGVAAGLDVWQTALTWDSYVGWEHTLQRPPGQGVLGWGIRQVPFVEIMMPFFSAFALDACWSTFTENYSGWGIEFLWPVRVPGGKFAVVDLLSARHTRPIQSETWRTPDGETALEECFELVRRHGLRGPQYGRFG